ncbi:MAG: hypothetical protein AAFR44_02195, partial [Pseudomonadota bacterium]
DELRNFKVKLKRIATSQSIPDYFVTLLDDPKSPILRSAVAEGLIPTPSSARQPMVAFHPKSGQLAA